MFTLQQPQVVAVLRCSKALCVPHMNFTGTLSRHGLVEGRRTHRHTSSLPACGRHCTP
jgi:hypothetical protein